MSPDLYPGEGRRADHIFDADQSSHHPDNSWPSSPYSHGQSPIPGAPHLPQPWGSHTPPPVRITTVEFQQVAPHQSTEPYPYHPSYSPPSPQQPSDLQWRIIRPSEYQTAQGADHGPYDSRSTNSTPDRMTTSHTNHEWQSKGPFARFTQMWRSGDLSNPVTEWASRHPKSTKTLAALAILATVSTPIINNVSGGDLGDIGNQITRAVSSERPDPVPPEIALGSISEIFPLGENDVYGVYTTSSHNIEIPYKSKDNGDPQLVRRQGALPSVEISSVDPVILRHAPKDPSQKTMTIQTSEVGKVKVAINWGNFSLNMPTLMQKNGADVDIGWQEPVKVSMNAKSLFTAEELKEALPDAAEGELDRLTPLATVNPDLAQVLTAQEKIDLAKTLEELTCFGSSETLTDQIQDEVSRRIIDALSRKSGYTAENVEVEHEGGLKGPLDDLLQDPVMATVNNPDMVGLKLTPTNRTCYTVEPSKMEGYVND